MRARRGEEATFDWFKRYGDVAHLLRPVLPDKTARILMLGCGNSTLSEDVRFWATLSLATTHRRIVYFRDIAPQMYDDGYKNIVNIDVRTKSFDCADDSFAR